MVTRATCQLVIWVSQRLRVRPRRLLSKGVLGGGVLAAGGVWVGVLLVVGGGVGLLMGRVLGVVGGVGGVLVACWGVLGLGWVR